MSFDGFDADGAADEVAWAFALFVTLLAIWEVVSSLASSDDPARRHSEQTVVLDEDALRRLEGGETVVVERWHGSHVELSGTQVIDATVVTEDAED